MTFQVFDCLADTEISRHVSRAEADDICVIHGGSDNCIYVFEIPEPVEKILEIKQQKPLARMLF